MEKTVTIERNGLRFTIQATQKEIDLNQHITLINNVLNVHIEPRPKDAGPITDPARLLPDKLHSETIWEIMARQDKDPWVGYRDVAKELRVHYSTIIRYCKAGLIEANHDDNWDRTSSGWFVRRSEVERIKKIPHWLKEFQKQKSYMVGPSKEEIRLIKQQKVIKEIQELHKYREPLNPDYVIKHYGGLYGRGKRWLGSWFNALYAAGIHPSQTYLRWDRSHGLKGRPRMLEVTKKRKAKELLQEIKTLIAEGKLDTGKRRELENIVYWRLGGWKEVYRLLGLKTFDRTDKKHFNIRTRELIIEEIQKLNRSGVKLNYKTMYKTCRSLVKAAEKKFGSWASAVRQAGVDYSQITLKKKRSKNKLMEKILSSKNKGGVLCGVLDGKETLALESCLSG